MFPFLDQSFLLIVGLRRIEPNLERYLYELEGNNQELLDERVFAGTAPGVCEKRFVSAQVRIVVLLDLLRRVDLVIGAFEGA